MPTLTSQQADLLLSNLADDAAYYARFVADPSAAVLELGLPEWLSECCDQIDTIASQAQIASTRQALLADLTSELLQSVPGLDVS